MFKPDPKYAFAGKLPVPEQTTNRKEPAFLPLSDLMLGQHAQVREITFSLASRLQQLAFFGLAPGCELRVRQRHPAVVVEIGHTTLALDFEVAHEILVEPLV